MTLAELQIEIWGDHEHYAAMLGRLWMGIIWPDDQDKLARYIRLLEADWMVNNDTTQAHSV